MFGMLTSLTKAAIGVVAVPVAVVRDTAEVLGVLDDSRRNHTAKSLQDMLDNIEDAADPRQRR